jgi:hypothetical protein
MFLSIGQTFAAVTVYVDIKQTEPSHLPFSGVETRVGKNVDATYSATAGYNGQPTLHAEEKITATTWTYTVSPVNDVTISPTSGSGSSASITAKSAEAGAYAITVTFEVKFTITKYKEDETVDSTRTEEYTGSGSATLNVKDGKFKVFIKPDDNFPLYAGDMDGYRNKLGVGEDANIIVEKEDGSADTVTFDYATPACSPSITINGSAIVAGNNSGSEIIQVYAVVNGVTEGPESIGVTVVEPNGIKYKEILRYRNLDFTSPNFPPISPSVRGACFIADMFVTPTDVSFIGVSVGEDTCHSQREGSLENLPPEEHPSWYFDCTGGNMANGCRVGVIGNVDQVGFYSYLPGGDGLKIWDIPWSYKTATMTDRKVFLTIRQRMENIGDKKSVVTKNGITVTRTIE